MTDTAGSLSRRPICVLGLGYVGLPLAVALAKTGRPVIGFDLSIERVEELRRGHSGIEDVSDEELRSVSLSLTLTDEIADCAAAVAYVICVPTPLVESQPDLTAVRGAAGSVAKVLDKGDLVILESTSYPGTTEEVVGGVIRDETGLNFHDDFYLAFSPERIDPANPAFGVTNTPKVVGGATARAGDLAAELYGTFVSDVVRVAGTREAEMAKLLENTFRHINIALVNELAMYCHALDIDIWQVIRAASTKPFGFMAFSPGPGVGGHCIPVDPSYLSWAVRRIGHQFRLIELAQDVNSGMPRYVVERLAAMLNDLGKSLSRAAVVCLGVAYKPNVGDTRESPAVEVMSLLRSAGAEVRYHDPHVPRLTIDGCEDGSRPLDETLLSAADVVVVLTAHRDIDWALLGRPGVPPVLDTRGIVPDAAHVRRL